MVDGLISFREKYKDFTDCYTVIGGTACSILLSEADIDFRSTKDIDMILIMEDRYKEFAQVFWEYIREGKYKCGWRSSNDVHFYRFTDPQYGFPAQIELFSKKPDYHLDTNSAVVPIHISEDVSSLSAILLNDDFYSFMINGREVLDRICVLDAAHLIPFKMYAWLDLSQKKAEGKHVNDRDIRKHKYDVFRLAQLIAPYERVKASGDVAESIKRFLHEITNESLSLSQIGLSITKDQALDLFRLVYVFKN